MKCKRPFSMRHQKDNRPLTIPCGQCMCCRINKQSSWILRNRLECLTSGSSSFWTLTLDDNALASFSHEEASSMMYLFFKRLRYSEIQAGNNLPIRYYGCLEYGGSFARPHFHMLIYNLAAQYREPESYRDGLPRIQYHLPVWPYGHVDIGEYNPATVAYTISYLMKDSREETLPTQPIRTRLPAIGSSGLLQVGSAIAQKHGTMCELPNSLRIGNRSYALDHWSKKKIRKGFESAGGKFTDYPLPHEKRLRALQTDEIFKAYPHILERFEKADNQRLKLHELKEQKKTARQEAASAIAIKRANAGDTSNAPRRNPHCADQNPSGKPDTEGLPPSKGFHATNEAWRSEPLILEYQSDAATQATEAKTAESA